MKMSTCRNVINILLSPRMPVVIRWKQCYKSTCIEDLVWLHVSTQTGLITLERGNGDNIWHWCVTLVSMETTLAMRRLTKDPRRLSPSNFFMCCWYSCSMHGSARKSSAVITPSIMSRRRRAFSASARVVSSRSSCFCLAHNDEGVRNQESWFVPATMKETLIIQI